jgi:hypothetical protein
VRKLWYVSSAGQPADRPAATHGANQLHAGSQLPGVEIEQAAPGSQCHGLCLHHIEIADRTLAVAVHGQIQRVLRGIGGVLLITRRHAEMIELGQVVFDLGKRRVGRDSYKNRQLRF